MFTGLIEEAGRVTEVRPAAAGARLVVAAGAVAEGLRVGDSIAVNGACLTAVEVTAGGLRWTASPRRSDARRSGCSPRATG